MNKCLIIDDMHPSVVPMLAEAGIRADYKPGITRDEFLKLLPEYSGLIVRSSHYIDKEALDRATSLKFIARAGAGLDMIDVEEAEKRNIRIFNAPEGNCDALAEHAVAMLLCMMNRIHIADQQVKSGVWNREQNRGYELKGKTIGLIGYGHMGKAFAKRLSAFECNVFAYDKYLQNYSDAFARASSMEDIFEEADILSFHIPLTPETKGMADEAYLRKFKKQFWLLNTARGEILPFKALALLLKENKIKGAALDVLENEKIAFLSHEEKLNFDFMVNCGRVLFTPHVGGWTYESLERINQVLAEKIKKAKL